MDKSINSGTRQDVLGKTGRRYQGAETEHRRKLIEQAVDFALRVKKQFPISFPISSMRTGGVWLASVLYSGEAPIAPDLPHPAITSCRVEV